MPFPSLPSAPIARTIVFALAALVHSASAMVLNSPSQTAVNAAIASPLIDYDKNFSGGAYTNGAWFGGASIVLAAASHAGNTSADARLLQQIRFSCTGGNEICANGGYPAQHELQATGMFAIAKLTPRIWNQITTAEKGRIDLIMKASLVSCAFTTSNNNPYFYSQRTLAIGIRTIGKACWAACWSRWSISADPLRPRRSWTATTTRSLSPSFPPMV